MPVAGAWALRRDQRETNMRYEDARDGRGAEGFWLRLRVRLLSRGRPARSALRVEHMSDRQLADIGLSRREVGPDWWNCR
jgi:uncharacterized protein YjiS (DUF1127 family)